MATRVSHHPANSYPNGFRQDNQYTYDDGVVVMPVAGRSPKHRRIRLHGGVGMRVVEWKVERVGKPPVLPTMTDTIGDTIISGSVSIGLPIPDPSSGSFRFAARGKYTYVQTDPRIVGTNALPTGVHPYSVEPMDTIADSQTSSIVQQAGTLTSMGDFDTLSSQLANAITNSGASDYIWPFTFIPAYFSSPLIAG